MLYSVDSGTYIKSLPHKRQYDAWRKRISDNDYDAICEKLMSYFDQSEVNTTSWIPGNDWTDTVYEPIYHACGDNAESAGLFFGLIVFKMLMDNDERVWSFGRYKKDEIPIKGMTYFTVKQPPFK